MNHQANSISACAQIGHTQECIGHAYGMLIALIKSKSSNNTLRKFALAQHTTLHKIGCSTPDESGVINRILPNANILCIALLSRR